MSMTLAEVHVEMAKAPERTHVLVREVSGEFVAEFEGKQFRAGSPFGLDSRLEAAGVPSPRSLYLIEEVSE